MTKQTGESYMSLEITESARGEVSDQTSEQQTVEGQGGQPVVVPVVPAAGTTGTQSKWTALCEKIHHILKNRRRVRRPAAPAPQTGPESFVITLPPESSSVAVTLSMEPSFKSSYKEEVKAVKIAWGATLVLLNVIRSEKTLAPLIYTSVGLLWLSIVCWLVIDQVYKQAKDDPKEDWLWNGVTACCYCSCAASFFTALFVVFFAFHVAKIFTVITCGFLCRALIFCVVRGFKTKDHTN